VYTPTQTLFNFKLAYNAPDYETYQALLSPEEFTLTAEETPPDFPAEWGWREETEAARETLGDAYHVLLEMEAKAESVGAPAAGATTYTTQPIDVRVRVWRDPGYCYYARGPVTFGFTRPDASAPWVISEIRDGTGASHVDVVVNEQTFPCSWAAIKWDYLRRKRERDARH
jgi:hypothetical protein